MIRYWPLASVTAVRTVSISTGLAASTVTPGNTAPDASLTVPEIDNDSGVWAYNPVGTSTTHVNQRHPPANLRQLAPFTINCLLNSYDNLPGHEMQRPKCGIPPQLESSSFLSFFVSGVNQIPRDPARWIRILANHGSIRQPLTNRLPGG